VSQRTSGLSSTAGGAAREAAQASELDFQATSTAEIASCTAVRVPKARAILALMRLNSYPNSAPGLNAPQGGPIGFEKFALSTLSGFASGMTMNSLRGGQMTAAQVATDAFGNALGNSIVERLSAPSQTAAPRGTPQNPIVDPNTGEHIVMGAPVVLPTLPDITPVAAGSSAVLSDGDADSILASLGLRTGSPNSLSSNPNAVLYADASKYTGNQVVSDAGGGAGSPAASPEDIFTDGTIKAKIFKNTEHGNLAPEDVNAIVLHRTGGSDAASTLAGYKNQTVGAHFLIDSDGTIYQTAGLDKEAWHVGNIRSKGEEENTWTSQERTEIDALKVADRGKFGTYVKDLHKIETQKGLSESLPLQLGLYWN